MITTAYDGTLKFDTQIDTKGFTAGANTIKTQANGLKSVIGKLGKLMIAAFSITALISFGKHAVQTASDLQEVQNVVDTAFGEMSYKMEEFAKTSIETFGLSELSAKKTASSFMAMAKGMQFPAKEASDMSLELTALSADMASFFNIAQDEAKTALTAVYTGETETLKRYGILITEVNLQEYARQQGIKKSIEKMTQQEKVMLRYNYIMQATALAQGDFARTSDSWANQTRVLSERWKEFLGILGNGLIQVLTPAIKMLNSTMSYLISFANTASKVLSSVFGLSSATSSVAKNTAAISTGTEDASTGLSDMGTAAKNASKDADKSVSGIDKLNIISENVADSSSDAADALSGIGGVDAEVATTTKAADTTALESSLVGVADRIKAAFDPVINSFNRLKVAMEPLKTFTAQALVDFYNNFLVPVGSWTLGVGLPAFIDAISNSLSTINWATINDGLKSLWIALAPFAINIGEGLLWFWTNVLVPLGSWTIGTVLPLFLQGLASVLEILNGVITAVEPLFLWLWDNFLQPIAAWTGGVIVSVLTTLVTALQSVSTWISANQALVAGMAVTIGLFMAAWAIAGIAEFIVNAGGAVGMLTTLTTAIWACTGAKIVDKAETLYICALYAKDFIVSIASSVAALGKQVVAFGLSTAAKVADKAETLVLMAMYAKDFVVSLATGTAALIKQAAQWVINTGLKIADTVATTAMTVATGAWNVICVVATAVTTAFGAAIAFLTSPIGLVILAIAAIIAIIVLLVKNWDTVKAVALKCWDGIKSVWSAVSSWFNKNVITPIAGFFKGLWEGIETGITALKKVFKTIFDALVGIVKTPINLIIDIINGMIGGITTGINAVIGALNNINFTVPDWVPLLGGKSIGFNLKVLKAPKIPKLATGTVVPAKYGEFMTIMGDSRYPEIVSPVPAMKQAFKEAMVEMGGGGSGEVTVNVYLSGKQIHTEVVKQDKEFQAQNGHSAFSPA